ncbi:unnamed protein product [Paramecium octaurelia]|uniref:Transmembrane protein n=1 Tax=Paramecium octaurelia TaxID=43137 RepID=A0A8S1TDA8_PAROT|nr:unnamed protein product [Paramecium octaurelia]
MLLHICVILSFCQDLLRCYRTSNTNLEKLNLICVPTRIQPFQARTLYNELLSVHFGLDIGEALVMEMLSDGHYQYYYESRLFNQYISLICSSIALQRCLIVSIIFALNRCQFANFYSIGVNGYDHRYTNSPRSNSDVIIMSVLQAVKKVQQQAIHTQIQKIQIVRQVVKDIIFAIILLLILQKFLTPVLNYCLKLIRLEYIVQVILSKNILKVTIYLVYIQIGVILMIFMLAVRVGCHEFDLKFCQIYQRIEDYNFNLMIKYQPNMFIMILQQYFRIIREHELIGQRIQQRILQHIMAKGNNYIACIAQYALQPDSTNNYVECAQTCDICFGYRSNLLQQPGDCITTYTYYSTENKIAQTKWYCHLSCTNISQSIQFDNRIKIKLKGQYPHMLYKFVVQKNNFVSYAQGYCNECEQQELLLYCLQNGQNRILVIKQCNCKTGQYVLKIQIKYPVRTHAYTQCPDENTYNQLNLEGFSVQSSIWRYVIQKCHTCFQPADSTSNSCFLTCIPGQNRVSSETFTYKCEVYSGTEPTNCIYCVECSNRKITTTGECLCKLLYYDYGTDNIDCQRCHYASLTCQILLKKMHAWNVLQLENQVHQDINLNVYALLIILLMMDFQSTSNLRPYLFDMQWSSSIKQIVSSSCDVQLVITILENQNIQIILLNYQQYAIFLLNIPSITLRYLYFLFFGSELQIIQRKYLQVQGRILYSGWNYLVQKCLYKCETCQTQAEKCLSCPLYSLNILDNDCLCPGEQFEKQDEEVFQNAISNANPVMGRMRIIVFLVTLQILYQNIACSAYYYNCYYIKQLIISIAKIICKMNDINTRQKFYLCSCKCTTKCQSRQSRQILECHNSCKTCRGIVLMTSKECKLEIHLYAMMDISTQEYLFVKIIRIFQQIECSYKCKQFYKQSDSFRYLSNNSFRFHVLVSTNENVYKIIMMMG